MLKGILNYYREIFKSRLPQEHLKSLVSIDEKAKEAIADIPLYHQIERLGRMRSQDWHPFGENPNLLTDDSLDIVSNVSRKTRLYDISVKLDVLGMKGTRTIMELFLRKGVDPSVLDYECWEALLNHVSKGHRAVGEFLLVKGVDITADLDGCCPLNLAAEEGNTDAVELLLDNGTTVSGQDVRGYMALHHAVVGGHADVVQLLLKRGANSSTSSNGRTPLLFAVQKGHSRIVDLLLKNGADLDATGEHDRTALHLACILHLPIICRLLIARGANPRSIDGYGHTCIDWAMTDSLTLSSLEVNTDFTLEDIPRKKNAALSASIRKHLSLGDGRSNFHLAKKLLFFGEEESACILLEQGIKTLPNGSISCGAVCDSCNSQNDIMGHKFTCKTCADVDLCQDCMEAYYVEGSNVIGCTGHEFLTVPRPIWYDLEAPAVNTVGESLTQFIDRLRGEFGE